MVVYTFRKKKASLTKKRKKNAAAMKKQPRLATAQFVRRLDRLVGLYKPSELRRYVNGTVLDQPDIAKFLKTGECDVTVLRDFCGAQPAPETIGDRLRCWLGAVEVSQDNVRTSGQWRRVF